jgi:xylulokinase
VVQRLSGRAISIPKFTELVAIGAAVQAAATFGGQEPQEVASRWHTSAGTLLEPMPRDIETISRHRAVRQLALDAVQIRQSKR